MKHLIGQQIFELKLDSEAEAAQMQHNISDLYWKELVPALDRLFSELSTADQTIEIDRLEIDLGQLSPGELRAEIIIPVLEDQIRKYLEENPPESSSDKVRYKKKEVSIFEQWLFFLEYGYFPWNLDQSPENWTKKLIEYLVSHTQAINQLRQLLIERPNVLQRLTAQHEPEFLQHLVASYTAKKQDKLLSYTTTLFEPEPFWQFVLNKVIIDQEKQTAKALIQSYEKEHQSEKRAEIISREAEQLAFDIEKALPEIPESVLSQGIYIQNAGLVLLHPFLKPFFEKVGLIEEQKIIDVTRAIHLMHYLATDELSPPEYELTLYKLLCGLPLNLPVAKHLKLKPEETEEADALLQAVIQHWGALGEVSNASIQQGFLKRSGKLVKEESGWKLYIERNTIDLLLNKLPWGINVIKLPWMPEMLKVDWI
jgi:hypothetical protein